MAHLLNVESARVVHGARTILDQVSLGLDDGMRIGVVGRNGDGKSTLLRVLAREQEPDTGRITHTRGVRLGLLHQSDEAGEATVRHLVLGDAPDHVWAADALARDVVGGLLGGLDAAEVGGLDAPLSRLSGGQRRRVALAALLARPHDVLLLDEPTNHLDVEGVAWLAAHLRSRWPAGRGALVVVTHDRWFLDAVCERTWEVHDGVVDSFEGGYAAYVLARAERSRIAAAGEERRQNLMRKELAWLRRGPPARTSKPRFRIDAATALIADEPPARDSLELARMATARLGKDVIDLEDVTVSVGSGETERVLLDGVTWRLAPGERVGLVGVNGAGKTTLLRVLLGQVRPSSGRVRRGKAVVTAMLSQDVRELDDVADLRVGEAVEKVRGTVRIGDRDVTAGQLLERLGFAKERIWTPVAGLSGGERRRVQLLRLLMGEPNVLLLDEPTNDLDTDTLAAIEDTLDSWPGTLVVVSHDRYLLERVTDHQVALLGDGALRDLPGGVEEYLELRSAATRSGSGNSGSSPVAGASPPDGTAQPDPADRRQARKDMSRIERQLSRLSGQEDKLHLRMAEQAGDHTALMALDAELRALHAERAALEEEWLLAAELAG
ncbi:MAG: ABC-F family ATP-binding cassette domain-containing protein [Kineosporiaceae bacterium]|nr:ABC-F family ATP-binding cassette domain-containing protein [Kineosporiaceae bacterium]